MFIFFHKTAQCTAVRSLLQLNLDKFMLLTNTKYLHISIKEDLLALKLNKRYKNKILVPYNQLPKRWKDI